MQRELTTSEIGDTDPQEAVLVQRAKARSAEAWTEIYVRHYRPIYRYARARVFSEPVAEDLAAAVFLEALKGIDSYRYQGRPLLAWLYRIARNVVGSHQRQALRWQGNDQRLSLDFPRRVIWQLMRRSRPDEDSGGATRLEAADPDADPALLLERLDLREALTKLTTPQREVVILRFVVGLSTEEIAGAMGKGPAAIYSLEARALAALRQQLGEG